MTADFWKTFIVLSVVGTAVGVLVHLLLPRVLAWRGVWFRWRTRFGPALVFDSADEDGTCVRLLNVNGTYQSVCYVDPELRWDPVCEYHRTWARVVHKAWRLGKAERAGESVQGVRADGSARAGGGQRQHAGGPVRRAFVMGGGGYSFPKWIVAYRPDFSCVAVEIDPAIVAIARERFFLDELVRTFNTDVTGRLELVEGDAWEVLRADVRGYDLIINDAFKGNRPLGPLQTHEGARIIKEHLRPGGRYIGNVRLALEGRQGRRLEEVRTAFAEVFDHVEIIPERPEEPRKRGNNALVAWDDDPRERMNHV